MICTPRRLLVSKRTAFTNHLRAWLLERGIVAPEGRRKLEKQLSTFPDENEIKGLTSRIRVLIEDLCAEWRTL
jgi:transposase